MRYFDGMGKDVTEYVQNLERENAELKQHIAKSIEFAGIKKKTTEESVVSTEESGTVSKPKRSKTTYADTQ